MPASNDETTDENQRGMRRIEELVTAIAKTMMQVQLQSVLDDKRHRLLYQNTGKLPVKKLAKKTGLSVGTISRTWQQWELSGLLIKDGKQYRKLFD